MYKWAKTMSYSFPKLKRSGNTGQLYALEWNVKPNMYFLSTELLWEGYAVSYLLICKCYNALISGTFSTEQH